MKITIVKAPKKFASFARGDMFRHKGKWTAIILKDKDTELYRMGILETGITWPESYSSDNMLAMLNRNPDDFEFLGNGNSISVKV